MTSGLPQETIERIQNWMLLRLAIHKPLVETIHMRQIFCHVVDAGGYSGVEADPYLGWMVREVAVSVGHYGHANGHEWEDGIHRIATVDGLLAAFRAPCFVKCDVFILQATSLIKFSDRLADAC